MEIEDLDEEQIVLRLKQILDEERFTHSINVRDYALKLSEGKGIRRERVVAAALLHDVAKGMARDEMFRYAATHGIPLNPGYELNDKTLHQHVGAVMSRQEFGITDAPVLSAISSHATGDTLMSELDIIIYLADKLEPDRDFEGVEELRELALRDINDAYLQTLRKTIIFVLERGLYLDEMSARAYNYAITLRHGKDHRERNPDHGEYEQN